MAKGIVLAVEDSAVQAAVFKGMLEKAGYPVELAANGIEALEKLKKVTVDLIVSDTLMPKMDGFQLCRECKGNDKLRKIPFILTSASYTGKKSEDFALNLGADRFVLKSLDPNQFIKIIDEIIQEYKDKPSGELKKPMVMEASFIKEHDEHLMMKLEEQMMALQEAQALGRIGSWEYDVGSKKITWSDQTYKLYERAPSLGPPSPEEESRYYSPESCKMTREYAQRAIEKGEEFGDYDLTVNLPGGKTAYFMASLRPVKDKTGRAVKLFGTVLDITERKRAEETLKERVKEFKCIADISRLAERPGISIEELVEKTTALLPAAWRYPEITCARIALDGSVFKTENFKETAWSLSADLHINGQKIGRVTVCYLNEKPAADEGPFIKEEKDLLNVVADFLSHIIQHRRTEIEIRESEARFKTIFDGATDGILLADIETKKFDLGNKRICEMLGYSLDEIKDLGVMEIHPKEELPYVMEQFEKQARGEFTLSKDLPVKRKDGSVFHADVNASQITLAGKKYLVGIFHDTTERKRAEDELKKKMNELEVFFKSAMDREDRILELKQKIEELKKTVDNRP